jgi:putative inorganic carbon (HCO3(-)) transporter
MSLPAWPRFYQSLRHALQGQVPGVGILMLGMGGLGLFAWIPLSYYRMVMWPLILLWQAGFALILGWLIWRLRQFERPFRPLGYGWDGVMVATVLGLGLSAWGAPFKAIALWQLAWVLAYGLLLYGLRNGLGTGWLTATNLWRAVAIAAGVSAAISLSFWRPTPGMWAAGNFAAAIRNAQPLGHHNFVGGYFALTLPLVVSLAVAERQWRRWLAAIAAVLVLMALYVSGSRGAALGFVAWVGVSVISRFWRQPTGRYQRWVGLGILGLAIAALVSNPRVRTLLQGLMGGGDSLLQIAGGDGPLVDRIFMAQAGFNLFQAHPLLGGGLGNISRLFNLYRPLEMGAGLDHVQQLHNTPIHLLGELGLVGIGLYLAWLGWGAWLWARLYRAIPPGADQALLFGIGGSVLAYGVSSLTDYQLENIPIALTLVSSVALLSYLGDRHLTTPLWDLPRLWRRLSSLGVLAILALLLRIWMPFDGALALQALAAEDVKAVDLASAQAKWLQAADIVPWDPTPAALAAENLIAIEAVLDSEADRASVQRGILDALKQAWVAAPYDAYFNSNLAVRLLPEDAALANGFAQRAVQLLPRTANALYYLLGLTYIAQDQVDEAVTAFSLEGLTTPQFTALPLWDSLNNPSLQTAVAEATLVLYDALLDDLTPQDAVYGLVYEQAQLLRWWHQQPPLDPVAGVEMRPLVQALLAVDRDPEQALTILNAAIADTPGSMSLQMLRAWLDPDNYLEDLLTLDAVEDGEQIQAHIRANRTVRSWLTSVTEASSVRKRQGLAFAYRNRYANSIELILRPDRPEVYALVDLLGLFRTWPREFPALDRLVEAIKAAELDLVHPTRNGYRLPKPSLDF